MKGLPIGLGEQPVRLNQDYSDRIVAPEELAAFTPDGAVPVTLAEQVGAFTTYLASAEAPEPFRRGYSNLDNLLTRTVALEHTTATLQHNPGRARNAADFQQAARARAFCFLDPEHLADGERGLSYNGSVIFGNLYPYMPGHLVVVDRSHAPQQLGPQLHTALKLAGEVPTHYFFYNGPEVGATAPDHLHLQGGLSKVVPILEDLRRLEAERPYNKLPLPLATDRVEAFMPTSIDRPVLVVRGYGREEVEEGIRQSIGLLTRLPDVGLLDVNFGVAAQDGQLTGLVFPRRRFRHPDFYQPGSPKLTPATAEMSGLWVAPVEEDFHAVTAEQIKEVSDAVSVPIEALSHRVGTLAVAS